MKLNYIRTKIKLIYYRLTMSKKKYNYYLEAKKLYEIKEYDNASEILKEATEEYPNTYIYYTLLVDIAIKKKDWKSAAQHWRTVFELRRRKPKEIAYLAYAKSLCKIKEYKEAEKLMDRGLTDYPESVLLTEKCAKIFYIQNNNEKVIDVLSPLVKKDIKLDFYSYYNLFKAYTNRGDEDLAIKLITNSQNMYTTQQCLHLKFKHYIGSKDWSNSIEVLKEKILDKDGKAPIKWHVCLSMLYMLVGDKDKANRVLISNNINNKNKHEKITIFYNGETKIDYYKKHKRTNTLVITFDSLNMTWKNSSPFAFKLLSKQDVDILAVRREQGNTQHQDLSREEFFEIVNKIVGCYEYNISYGYSLGGYTSLYYGSIIDSTILSLAPRLSIHPKFGREGHKSEHQFKHELYLPVNKEISPIIVYDPKQRLDNRFVQDNALRAYPTSNLIPINYGGHGIAPHLSRTGQLKRFVLTVVNDREVPKYNRKLKEKSNIYLRVLGQACLNRNKLNWANDLANRSLDLLETDKFTNRLKFNVLKAMGNYEKAIEFAYKAKQNVPKDITIRVYLIDLLLKLSRYKEAQEELSLAIKEFGNNDSLLSLKKRFDNINIEDNTFV